VGNEENVYPILDPNRTTINVTKENNGNYEKKKIK
jgi:hypothetical protein